MPSRRTQRARFGTRAVQAAGRAVASAARGAYRYAMGSRTMGYQTEPNRVARLAKRTAGAFFAGSVGRVAYKKGQKTVNVLSNYVGGNDITISKKTVGQVKKPTVQRLNRLIRAGMNQTIWRFQGITNYDTNSGGYRLSNVSMSHDSSIMTPVHIYDLTCFQNSPSANNVAPGRAFGWTSALGTADVKRIVLPNQIESGGVNTNGIWRREAAGQTTTSGIPNARVMLHDWSDIRINFYGPRKRTTKFEVVFFRIKDTLANPLNATASNKALKELIYYLERPCIYSNLQSYNGNVAKKMQIVKRFTYFVSAAQTTDVDTSVGKIKEARIFMRHGNIYNLDWRHEQGAALEELPHGIDDGIDWVQDLNHHDYPWHGSRLFMMVRAFSPERTALTTTTDDSYTPLGGLGIGISAAQEPSYDIIIRNAISTPA